jgi:xylitol oxidase
MKKRTFLKTSSALVTGSLLSPLASCVSESAPAAEAETEAMTRTNWAGNLTYHTGNLHEPGDVAATQKAVRDCEKLRALGTRHCFNDIADSQFNQVSVRSMAGVVELNEEAQTVTVEAGAAYGQFCPWLHEQGYAVHNLASLPHISVAGAIATATHGSGAGNGNLATPVTAIEFINAKGDLVSLSREKDGEKFAGAVVHLGALGVLTKVTLKVEPTFQMYQYVYQDLPVSELLTNFEAVMSAGYSVSLFTDYQTDHVNQVWVKSRVVAGRTPKALDDLFGAKSFDRKVHPILDHPAQNCTEQLGTILPWYEVLPHFKMEFTPSSGKELQAEYFVPAVNAPSAYRAIQDIREQLGPVLMISEVRAIAADDHWMSPCYGQDSIAFHFTLEQDWERVQKVLPEIESRLDGFQVRPHWGKMYTMPKAKMQSRYAKLGDFRGLMREYDPDGKFINGYMEEHLI